MQEISFHLYSSLRIIDYEWQEIIKRLRHYGVKSSGSKALDYEMLRALEQKEAQKTLFNSENSAAISETEQTYTAVLNYQQAAEILGRNIYYAVKK